MVFVNVGDKPSSLIASPAVPRIVDCVSAPAASPAAMPRSKPNIHAELAFQAFHRDVEMGFAHA